MNDSLLQSSKSLSKSLAVFNVRTFDAEYPEKGVCPIFRSACLPLTSRTHFSRNADICTLLIEFGDLFRINA